MKEGANILEQLKVLTAVYDQGLGCGFLTIEDVIRWCDEVIDVFDNPPYEFIELSMMSSEKIEDIKHKLLDYYMNVDIDIEFVVNLLLGVIGREFINKHLSIQESVGFTTKLLIHTGLFSAKGYYDIYRCDDAYDLAVEGIYGGLEDVERDFTNAISQFEFYYSIFIDLYKSVMTVEWGHK